MRAGTASRRSRATRPLGRTSAPKAGDTRASHICRGEGTRKVAGRSSLSPTPCCVAQALVSAHVVGDRVRSLRISDPSPATGGCWVVAAGDSEGAELLVPRGCTADRGGAHPRSLPGNIRAESLLCSQRRDRETRAAAVQQGRGGASEALRARAAAVSARRCTSAEAAPLIREAQGD